MNEDLIERLINAAVFAVGVALCVTLVPTYVALGAFMIAMSCPDCFGFFEGEVEEFWDEEVPVDWEREQLDS